MAYSRTKSAIAPRLIGSAAAAGALALAAGQAVGQMIAVNFAGSSYAQTNLIPPDPSGAAGDNYFVEFVKGRTAAYRKSDGALVSSSTDTAFWSSAGVSPAVGASLSYPRVVFDHASGRWFASAVDVIGGSIANTNNI